MNLTWRDDPRMEPWCMRCRAESRADCECPENDERELVDEAEPCKAVA